MLRTPRVLSVAGPLWLLAVAAAQQAQWVVDRTLPGDFQGQLAYDEARERAVLFGCVDLGDWQPTPRSFTFEWDGERWVHRHTEAVPIRNAALCYDSARKRVVRTFGGYDGMPSAQTWEWDGQTWTPRASATVTARWWHAATFHAATGTVLAHGGSGPLQTLSFLGDTLRLVGNTWTTSAPAVSPGMRYGHAMAYDPGRQRSVLFGGNGPAGPRNDTWEWDGLAWSPRPSVNQPSVRSSPALAHDPRRGRTVLFGGAVNLGALNDTWEWDGTNWQQVATVHAPPHRAKAALVFDRGSGRMLLFGGNDNAFTRYTDTWSYDGVDWQLLSGPSAPSRRVSPGLVADTARGRLVQFTGYPDDGFTWEWDGRTWQRLQPVPPPFERYAQHAAFDPCRAVTVLFGGRSPGTVLGDTWEWNGTTWAPRTGMPTPSPRWGGCMAFDAGRCVAVLFGGQDFQTWYGETWEWNGTTWSQRLTATTPTVANFAMTWDPALGRIVMFGGSDLQGPRSDTWHYDGVDWTLRGTSGPTSPPPRYYPAIAFDAGRGRTVMFGGGVWGAFHDDLWEWDGSQWTPVVLPVRPDPQTMVTLAYDFTTSRLVATGGQFGDFADTWVLAPQGPATAAAFGTGCGVGAPPLLRSAAPFLGNERCAVEIAGAAALAPVVFAGSLTAASVTLPAGCTEWIGPPFVTALRTTNLHGGASCSLAVPMAPALRGATAVLQAVVFDGLGPHSGTSWTAGLRLTVGD